MTESFFSPCPRGLENELSDELRALGARRIASVPGGVGYEGDWSLVWRVNLESRIATRVLWRVAQGRYRGEEEIFRLAYATTWAKWFTVEDTLRIYVTAIKSDLRSLQFITLRIKDGICDHFRAVTGNRPSINTESPDVRVHAFLTADTCTLYVDTSGEPLYKRGYKPAKVEAPLKENLAAGILRLSGWQPGQTLLDPMCGSGTFLIEAAHMALDHAPGLGRRFAFEGLKNHNATDYKATRATVEQRRKPRRPLAIIGSDIDSRQVRAAEENLSAAGLDGLVSLRVADFINIKAPAAEGVIVSNPPYGVRLGESEDLAAWYPQIGDTLKRNFPGWRAYFLSADMSMAKGVGLKPSKRTPLFNGELDCRLFEYLVIAGQNRKTNES